MGTRRVTLGREVELSVFAEELEAARGGDGRVVLVTGEAGAGKTQLVEAFEERHPDTRFYWGSCVDAADTLAYAPWTQLLRSVVDDLGEAAVDDERNELAMLLSGLGEAREWSTRGRTVLFDAVVRVMRRAAASAPVFVIDDLHWIDAASRDLLLVVMRSLRRTGILLVGTFREEDANENLRDVRAQLAHGATTIALSGLRDDIARDLVSQLWPESSPALVDAVVQRAGGNPFFLEELARSDAASALPVRLKDVLLARTRSLSSDAQAFVRTAAIIGLAAPRPLIAATLHLADERLRDAAREAVDRGVLVTDDATRGYRFRHALWRDAVLADLVPDETVVLHGAVARALEDHTEAGLSLDRVSELARHWDLAECPTEALRASIAAAERAMARYAFEAAFVAYERALHWWPAADSEARAEFEYVSLLFDAADAGGASGHLQRAAELSERCRARTSRAGELRQGIHPRDRSLVGCR